MVCRAAALDLRAWWLRPPLRPNMEMELASRGAVNQDDSGLGMASRRRGSQLISGPLAGRLD